jgi:hypothetical protein
MRKYERCVLAVKAKQSPKCKRSGFKKKGCYNPWAVCTKSVGRDAGVRYSSKRCPKGSISRRSYRKRSGSRVRSGCVKSKGLRSRGLRSNRVIPKLRKGTLSKYGYTIKEKSSERHNALDKAIKAYGYSTVIKKLNAVRTLTKNTFPKNAEVYSNDIKYLQKKYKL